MEEIHAGICGNHAASKTLVGKAMRQGFYWPTIVEDAAQVVPVFCKAYSCAITRVAHDLYDMALCYLGA